MQILIQNLKRIIFNFSPKNIFLLHKISLFLNLKGKIIYFRGSKYTKFILAFIQMPFIKNLSIQIL
jgi:hypothetical protein